MLVDLRRCDNILGSGLLFEAVVDLDGCVLKTDDTGSLWLEQADNDADPEEGVAGSAAFTCPEGSQGGRGGTVGVRGPLTGLWLDAMFGGTAGTAGTAGTRPRRSPLEKPSAIETVECDITARPGSKFSVRNGRWPA